MVATRQINNVRLNMGAWVLCAVARDARPAAAIHRRKASGRLEHGRQLRHNRRASYLLAESQNSRAIAAATIPESQPMEQRQELRKAGLKVTLPRLKILEILEGSTQRHLSAEDLYKELLDSGEDIGLATVYRVLTQFEAAGLVTRHNFEGGHSVFELDDGKHHDHMVCVETGDVIEFVNEDIERLREEMAEKHGYQLLDHNLVLYVKPKESSGS